MNSVRSAAPAATSKPTLGRRRLLALLIAAGALSGCASLLDPRVGPAGPTLQWRGRFSLSVEPSPQLPDGQRQTGSFELSQGPGFTEIELLSPLGNTIASARETPAGALLRTADGRQYEDRNADALTEQIFGWRIPVRRLPDWLQGRIAEVTEAGETAAQPQAGEEDGWRVRFEGWRDTGPLAPPARLVIAYPGRVMLRLVVDGADAR